MERKPRSYAKEIINAGSLGERRRLLALVPREWRELVEKHVRIGWERGRERLSANNP